MDDNRSTDLDDRFPARTLLLLQKTEQESRRRHPRHRRSSWLQVYHLKSQFREKGGLRRKSRIVRSVLMSCREALDGQHSPLARGSSCNSSTYRILELLRSGWSCWLHKADEKRDRFSRRNPGVLANCMKIHMASVSGPFEGDMEGLRKLASSRTVHLADGLDRCRKLRAGSENAPCFQSRSRLYIRESSTTPFPISDLPTR